MIKTMIYGCGPVVIALADRGAEKLRWMFPVFEAAAPRFEVKPSVTRGERLGK
jgi:hypothetical protein